MTTAMQIDIRVLGGLEITVEFTTGYEDGECGYPGHYVDEWYIVAIAWRNLRKGEKCDWLYKRIEAAKEEDMNTKGRILALLELLLGTLFLTVFVLYTITILLFKPFRRL